MSYCAIYFTVLVARRATLFLPVAVDFPDPSDLHRFLLSGVLC